MHEGTDVSEIKSEISGVLSECGRRMEADWFIGQAAERRDCSGNQCGWQNAEG